MNKLIRSGLVFLFLGAGSAAAVCPQADRLAVEQGMAQAIPIYEQCALSYNDDDSQLRLARIYEKGGYGLPQNLQKALLFFHLSAENGHAEAQAEYARLLLQLDETEAGRQEILRYLPKIQASFGRSSAETFKGELLHPYTLLLLAGEDMSQRWFYPVVGQPSHLSAQVLKDYPMTPEKRAAAVREATVWKQRKLLEAAKEVYSPDAYAQFYETLFPNQGHSDDFTRARRLEKLQEDIARHRRKHIPGAP